MKTQSNKNKQIVLSMYKEIIGALRLDEIDAYIDEHYIQHSPLVKDGRAGLLEMLHLLKTMPRPAGAKSPVVRAVAEDDLVVVHLDVTFMGRRLAVIDIFRLKSGKIAEHWSVEQPVPDIMAHQNGMF